eukprot:gene22014-8615_t
MAASAEDAEQNSAQCSNKSDGQECPDKKRRKTDPPRH